MLKPQRSKQSSPAIDFFQDLVYSLYAEQMELMFDYFLLHWWFWRLLRDVNEACKEHLRQMFNPGYLKEEYLWPHVVGYIFMAATNASDVGNLIPKERRPKSLANCWSSRQHASQV